MSIPLERGEEARAAMIELFPEGFEERDDGRELELSAYTNAGGEERIWQVFGAASVTAVSSGWAEAWKLFHRPVRVGPLWVGPPWEVPDDGALAVVIDPGQAFGTGGHPTTRLCLELLLERRRTSIADLGCGSGVLAIAAAKLGFGPVVALDDDPAALRAVRENAQANGVDLEVRRSDVLIDPLPSADLALANIERHAAQVFLERLPAATFIASGYLASDEPSLSGWVRRDRRELGGWAADLFERG